MILKFHLQVVFAIHKVSSSLNCCFAQSNDMFVLSLVDVKGIVISTK